MDKKNRRSKTRFDKTIKKCAKLTVKKITSAYKSKVIKFKLEKDLIQILVYFLSLMNSLKIILSPFSDKYMLLMDYPFTKG